MNPKSFCLTFGVHITLGWSFNFYLLSCFMSITLNFSSMVEVLAAFFTGSTFEMAL